MNQIEKIIDIATWNRKEHFEHFSAFDDPFFGVTVHVDCTRSYQEAKDKGVSFSLLLLHRIITAASTSYHHCRKQSRGIPLPHRGRQGSLL